MKEIKLYGNSLDKIKNKKARKTYEVFIGLYPWHDFFFIFYLL